MSSKFLSIGDSCIQHSFGFLMPSELAKISSVCTTFNKLGASKVVELLKSKSHLFKFPHPADLTPAQQNEFWHTAFGTGPGVFHYGHSFKGYAPGIYGYADFLKCAEIFRNGNLNEAFEAFKKVPHLHSICFGSLSSKSIEAEFPFDDEYTDLRHRIFYEHYLLLKDRAPAGCFNFGELSFLNQEGYSSTGAQKAEAMERVAGKILPRWASFKPIFCFNRYLTRIVEPHSSKDAAQKLRNEVYGCMYRLLGSPKDVADNFGEVVFESAHTTGDQKWKAIEETTGKPRRAIEFYK